jgi:hypothetical protein
LFSLHKLFFTLFLFTLEIQKGICENGSYRLFGLKLKSQEMTSYLDKKQKRNRHPTVALSSAAAEDDDCN